MNCFLHHHWPNRISMIILSDKLRILHSIYKSDYTNLIILTWLYIHKTIGFIISLNMTVIQGYTDVAIWIICICKFRKPCERLILTKSLVKLNSIIVPSVSKVLFYNAAFIDSIEQSIQKTEKVWRCLIIYFHEITSSIWKVVQ